MQSTQSDAGRILIVEDEPALLRALQINLGLPDMDGTEVIRQLRSWTTVPVIVLSGRAGSGDKIGALDAGADDYVTKPFSMEELVARLRAALRRDSRTAGGPEYEIGNCLVDLTARTVIRRGGSEPEPVHLTKTEWRTLDVLLKSAGQLVPSSRLLAE